MNKNIFKKFIKLPQTLHISNITMEPFWAKHWHKTTNNELIYVLKGKIHIKLFSGVDIYGEEGSTILIPVSTNHKDEFDYNNDIQLFYIFFKWKPIKEYLKIISPSSFARVSNKISNTLIHNFNTIKNSFFSGQLIDEIIVQINTLEILLCILRSFLSEKHNTFKKQNTFKNSDLLFIQAKNYIENNYNKTITLDEVAKKLNISSFYLSHIFNQKSKTSFIEYLTNLRIKKAFHLLQTEQMNIAQVAYKVGYNDSHYFTRIFKQKFGITPKELKIKKYLHNNKQNSSTK